MKTAPNFFQKMRYGITMAALASLYKIASAQIGIQAPVAPAPVTGPSLQETTNWLAEKIDTDRSSSKTSKTEFSGCELRRTINDVNFGTKVTTIEMSQLEARNIVLADLVEGNGERPGFTRVWINTLGQRNSVVTNNTPPTGIRFAHESQYKTIESYVLFYFPERELAERVKNAFQHGISLCIRQAAERKAAEPPKAKEIF